MSCHKGIAVAFPRFREAGYSAKLAQMVKIRLAAGQQLMDIRLMAYIKNQAVNIRIKHSLDGDSELNNAQITRQMAAGMADRRDKKFPDLPAKFNPFTVSQADQVLVTGNILQNAHENSRPNIYFFFFLNAFGKCRNI